VMRSNLWASGYDVDGTDQTSLGQFSGRVQQTYKHSVPRFFVPEHGTMFTLAQIGRAVQQECRDRSRMPTSAWKKKVQMHLLHLQKKQRSNANSQENLIQELSRIIATEESHKSTESWK